MPGDDGVARLERGRRVALLAVDAVEDVAGELLVVVVLAAARAGVDRLEVAAVRSLLDPPREARAGLHRRLDVDDGFQRLVVDEDRLCAVLCGSFRLGDHHRHRLAGEDHFLPRERLGGAVGALRWRWAGRPP